MPIVEVNGKTKHFPYTKKGMKMAKKAQHHSGKGSRARLNTIAEKTLFGNRFSK